MQHLAGLDQRQRLEQLVQRPEAAGKDDEALARLHEADLARVEVPERVLDVEVVVRPLLVGKLDVEADRQPSALLAPRFAASITPPPPPVTTAQPRSPKSRPVSRAAPYAG